MITHLRLILRACYDLVILCIFAGHARDFTFDNHMCISKKTHKNRGNWMCLTIVLTMSAFSSRAMSNSLLDIYGNIPYVSDMKVSPSGKKIAYLQDNDGQYVLVHKNLIGTIKQKAFGVTEGHIRDFMWLNDDRIILYMTIPVYSPNDYEQFTLFRSKLLNLNTSETIDPFDSISYKFNIDAPKIVSVLPQDPEHILMSHYKGSRNLLFKVNIENGDKKLIDGRKDKIVRLVNTNGDTVLFRSFSKDHDKSITYYKVKGRDDYQPLMIKNSQGEEVFTPFINGFDTSEKYIYFIKNNKDNFKVGYRAEIVDGYVENIKVVAHRKGIDINYFVEDEQGSNSIIGGHFTDDYSFTNYFDPHLAQVQSDLVATFPHAGIFITSFDSKREKFVVEITGPSYGLEYYFYDTKAGTISHLANAYPTHKAITKASVKPFSFIASDDTKISGYFTKPNTKKTPPLIVIPHGGPASRDTLSFDWIRQYFSNNGFAVLQVNFRGSSGFGKNFKELGHGQWGKKMQTDLDEAVATLIKDNLVDKEKICIVGSSYGGYAALIGATKNPSLYKCAVSFAGISYLEDIFYHEKEQGGTDDYFIKSIGNRFNTDELKKYSPANLVTEKTSPILLLHGDKDTIVPESQSRRMYKALKKTNLKNNKFMIVKGADHWFSKSLARKIFLEESFKFIHEHIDK